MFPRTHVAVNIASINGISAHVGIQIPDANRVVAGAGNKRAVGQDAFQSFFRRRVWLDAPNAGRMVKERMRFAHLQAIKRIEEINREQLIISLFPGWRTPVIITNNNDKSTFSFIHSYLN